MRVDDTARIGPLVIERPEVELGSGPTLVGADVLAGRIVTFDPARRLVRFRYFDFCEGMTIRLGCRRTTN